MQLSLLQPLYSSTGQKTSFAIFENANKKPVNNISARTNCALYRNALRKQVKTKL